MSSRAIAQPALSQAGLQGPAGATGATGPAGPIGPTAVETKTDDYTLLTADANKLFLFDKATAVDCDVDTALNLTPGQQIEFIQIGAGELTLVAGAGVTINSPALTSLAAQYCKATLTCIATDVYVLNGELATP